MNVYIYVAIHKCQINPYIHNMITVEYSNGLHTTQNLVQLLKNPTCSPVYKVKLTVLPRILNYSQNGNIGWIIPQDDNWITYD